MYHELIQMNEEVQQAYSEKKPIVVLESTLISHGMPYPDNLHTGALVEQIVRDQGATPATVALSDGKIHIGVDSSLMEQLAKGKNVIKASRRDISYLLSRRMTASTTVAATLFCANVLKLPVFSTGGIGGVHKQVEEYFDISADLIELSNTPITVVCSGAKSILDLPKTLEVLETHGVPVIGYHTNEFPAFYSHSSGLPLWHRLDTPEDVAQLMNYQRQLQLKNGIVIANPIPQTVEIPHEEIRPLIQKAQESAVNEKIHGHAITPYLLKKITEFSEGRSLKANIELIKHNAALGAQIAIAYQAYHPYD